MQARRKRNQHTLEQQKLPAVVQRHLRCTAGPCQNAGRKQLEGQDLRMSAGRRPAGPAHIHLRHMRGMLRHKQNLLRGVAESPDLFEHSCRFSRAGTSE